jgi:hypothetical protein
VADDLASVTLLPLCRLFGEQLCGPGGRHEAVEYLCTIE